MSDRSIGVKSEILNPRPFESLLLLAIVLFYHIQHAHRLPWRSGKTHGLENRQESEKAACERAEKKKIERRRKRRRLMPSSSEQRTERRARWLLRRPVGAGWRPEPCIRLTRAGEGRAREKRKKEEGREKEEREERRNQLESEEEKKRSNFLSLFFFSFIGKPGGPGVPSPGSPVLVSVITHTSKHAGERREIHLSLTPLSGVPRRGDGPRACAASASSTFSVPAAAPSLASEEPVRAQLQRRQGVVERQRRGGEVCVGWLSESE